jgi:hypothetical protein
VSDALVLLPPPSASQLATAYLYANTSIVERLSLAETGGFVFSPSDMYNVIANAGELSHYVHPSLSHSSLS